MNKYTIYTIVLAAMTLVGCQDRHEVEKVAEGQEITLSFTMDAEMDVEPVMAPMRVATANPGDPGKDDFLAPTNLYFVLWVETTGHTKMMSAVKVSGLTKEDWQPDGKGIYTLKDRKYKFILPKDGQNVQQLEGGVFHVFAFASTQEIESTISFTDYDSFTDDQKTNGKLVENTDVTLATLQTLKYAIPSGVTTQDGKRDFFRSIYSTALSETSHNQMATSPTIRLRHTAARLDINWECPTATTGLPKDQTSPLTANSTWTIALASNIMPTSFSLFTPGNNGTGSAAWSETITIDEGMRYNGRYVTYLPMPTTPTFTVTSSVDAINSDGADATAKKTKTLALTAGSNTNYATWMRALWTIK